MSGKTVEYTTYIIIVSLSIVVVAIIWYFISSNITFIGCKSSQKSEIEKMLEKYKEIFLFGRDIVNRYEFFLDVRRCVDWIYAPCGNKGICIKFTDNELFCFSNITIVTYYVLEKIDFCNESDKLSNECLGVNCICVKTDKIIKSSNRYFVEMQRNMIRINGEEFTEEEKKDLENYCYGTS